MSITSERTATLTAEIVNRLRRMFPQRVGLHEPCFGGNETAYLTECVDTGWVSSVGKFVNAFEAALSDLTGTGRAVAVVNGTAALHLCLQLAAVEPGDEVLLPAMTFVATANAVMYCRATPHFSDVSPITLGLDPHKLEAYLHEHAERRDDGYTWNTKTGRRVKACVPMHTFGHPVEIDTLKNLCDAWNITLVEDAAESLGSTYQGRQTGTFGTLAALSFNGNKIITTGGGGAVLTRDPALGERAKHLSTTAKQPHAYEFIHDEVGYNYRMPNINAALGCAQLEQLPRFLQRKRALAEQYREVFADLGGVEVFKEPPHASSNYWLNALLLDSANAHLRDDILVQTNAAGIMTRPVWKLMPDLPMYAACPSMDLSVARDLERRLVNLPSSVFLS